jgi:hypothetical protein
MKFAPIGLFVYNRLEHTTKTVEALRQNDLAARSELFVFADGPRTQAAAAGVQQIRAFIHSITGFHSLTVIEREQNFGLSKSIVAGVSQLCGEFGRAIAVEDDVVTAPDFLTFLNEGLDRYRDEPRTFSVSGFNYPITVATPYPYDAFFSYRFPCWGWGTWKDRWQKTDWSVEDFSQFTLDPERQKRFNRGGNDLSGMLASHMAGKIDSWDTVWGYTHSKHDAVAVLPTISKVYNIGLDGSGVHCRRAPFEQKPLKSPSNGRYRFPEAVALNPHFVHAIHRLHRRSISRRVGSYVLGRLGLR